MSDFKVMQRPILPRFDTLKYRVVVDRVLTLKELAVIYTWCCNNTTEWNLQIENLAEELGRVTFAFNDELEALMFKLTWAC
jgi:hypothetical protein